MKQHQHFDEAKIKATNEALAKVLADRLNEAGGRGAEARFKNALTGGFNLALAQEINRGTDTTDLFMAASSVIAHLILTLVFSSTNGPEGTMDQRTAVAQLLLNDVALCVVTGIEAGNDCIAASVEPEKAGRA